MLTGPETIERRRGVLLQPARRRRFGGALGNAHLTSVVGAVLIVLLAVEGATIPLIHRLLSVHVFVGMLLLGPVALKLATVGYRFVRYYLGGADYVRAGPPIPLMRFLVAPVIVVSTLTLFGSGVALVVSPQRGLVLGLHKASFVVWFGATALHVLVYLRRALRHVLAELWSGRVGGRASRLALVALSVAAGVAIALGTYSLASPWFHGALARGFDFHH